MAVIFWMLGKNFMLFRSNQIVISIVFFLTTDDDIKNA